MPPSESSETAQPTRILVVDDDPAAIVLHERILTDAGYQVLKARNGREAMACILADGPLLILTDWSMPEMDGLELCREIRSHEAIPFAYVIVLTASDAGPEQIAQALEAGADDYLKKPFQRRELVARIHAGKRIVHLHEAVDCRNRELHRANADMAIAYSRLGEANELLKKMVVTDELTGLYNRREAMNRLSVDWASSVRRGTPLACIGIDIDKFKSINDTHGHAVGDAVLKETARVLSTAARREESVCRIGGEEFLVLCSQATSEEAQVAAERLRAAVESTVVRTGELELSMTISLGVAQRTKEMNSFDDLLREADHALYDAKKAGRNRVVVAGVRSTLPEPALSR